MLAGAAELVRTDGSTSRELLQLARLFNLAVAPLAESAAAAIRRDPPPSRRRRGDPARGPRVVASPCSRTWCSTPGGAACSGCSPPGARPSAATRLSASPTSPGSPPSCAGTTTGGWRALDRLEAVAFDVVARHGGRVIKTIGDEVMWVHPEPAGMVAITIDLARAAAADPTLPAAAHRRRLGRRPWRPGATASAWP